MRQLGRGARWVFCLPERVPQPSPAVMRCVHWWLAVLWLAVIPVSLWLGWLRLVVYVSAISLYANVVGHWSGWSAERPTETMHEEPPQ